MPSRLLRRVRSRQAIFCTGQTPVSWGSQAGFFCPLKATQEAQETRSSLPSGRFATVPSALR